MPLVPARIHGIALGVILALVAPLEARASDDTEKLRTNVDQTIYPLMSRHDIAGMAVALTVDGRSYVFNYGVSSRQRQTPVTDSTIFEIGSITKMFTATLAAYAQATGRLSLEDHPGHYLPRLLGAPVDQATLLHLGTYTAGGLPLQFPDAIGDDAAAMVYLHDWKADAPPGTVRRYSNPSIGLLGAATAAALNERFATLVETRLLPGFGMRHSYIHVPARLMPDYAWGYRKGEPVRASPGPLDEETYGMKSTASDMIRFLQVNIDPSGLETPLRRAIDATHVGYFKVGAMVQGFGWEQYPYPLSSALLLAGNSEKIIFEANPARAVAPTRAEEPRLFDKTGSTGGFSAYVAFVPAKRIGLVMLANGNLPIAARVAAAYAILDRLAPH